MTITQIQLIAIIAFSFGMVLSALALHRKYTRRKIQGLSRICQTDRAAFTRKSENIIRNIGLALVIIGLIGFSYEAIRLSPPTTIQ